MDLILDDNYKVQSDTKQYILLEKIKSENKDEEDNYKSIGYHGSISNLLKNYKNQKLKKSSIKTVDELFEKLNEIEKTYIELGEKIEKEYEFKKDKK